MTLPDMVPSFAAPLLAGPFLAGFVLAGCIALFWLLPARWRDMPMALVFVACLASIDPGGILVMGIIALSAYLLSRDARVAARFTVPFIALVAAYFVWVKVAGMTYDAQQNIFIVPLGVSYFTFRMVHYVIDRKKGRLPAHGFATFLLYAFFLPIFSAGPIQRFDGFVLDRTPTVDRTDIVDAAGRLLIGLVKAFGLTYLMILLAGTDPGGIVARLYGAGDPPGVATIWAGLVFLSFYYYFNMAGYADLVIGASRLMGFRIAENFDAPFLASNMADFWRRWHMTLGDWCKRYIFNHLAIRYRSFAAGLFPTFIAIGLWHGIGLHWVLWGAMHGGAVYVSHHASRRGTFDGVPVVLRRGLGMGFVLAFFSFSMILVNPPPGYPVSGCFALMARALGF